MHPCDYYPMPETDDLLEALSVMALWPETECRKRAHHRTGAQCQPPAPSIELDWHWDPEDSYPNGRDFPF